MSFIYTRSQLKSRVNAGIQNKIGLLINVDDTLNEAVREVLTEIRIRSTRRKAALVPNLLTGSFEYAVASDLHGLGIIDIPAQAKREDGEFNLVPTEQWTRAAKRGDIAIGDYNGQRVLYINSQATDESTSVDPMTETGTGEWQAFGDGTNLSEETDDTVKNNKSIEFDISAAAGTTAGITKTRTTGLDLSEFLLKAAGIFTYARITSTTGLTNYKLRIGTSASAYYEYTVTTKNDGTAFSAGWNLLRFDLATPTSTTGSPSASDIKYFALYMTKATSKVSESGYMFNWFEARKGKYADVLYYSKFGWQTAAGAYIENSTEDTDILVADTDEFDLFVKKGRVLAGGEADLQPIQIQRLENEYTKAMKNYQMLNPSEDKMVISTYYDYGSRDDGVSSNSLTD